MTTIAQQILNRINALEEQVGDIQLQGGVADQGPRPPTESIRNLTNQIQELRTQLQDIADSRPERRNLLFEERREESAKFLAPSRGMKNARKMESLGANICSSSIRIFR